MDPPAGTYRSETASRFKIHGETSRVYGLGLWGKLFARGSNSTETRSLRLSFQPQARLNQTSLLSM